MRAALIAITASALASMTVRIAAAEQWTAYLRHVGPLAIGMTMNDVRRALDDADAHLAFGDRAPDDADCAYVESPRLPTGVLPMFEDGKLVRIDVFKQSPARTASGARIGDSEHRIVALYKRTGRVEIHPNAYMQNDGNDVVWHPRSSADAGLGLRFITHQGVVMSYSVGTLQAISLIEGC